VAVIWGRTTPNPVVILLPSLEEAEDFVDSRSRRDLVERDHRSRPITVPVLVSMAEAEAAGVIESDAEHNTYKAVRARRAQVEADAATELKRQEESGNPASARPEKRSLPTRRTLPPSRSARRS
jgi:hypothetical protein